jgi:hypothetical protein
MPMLGYLYCARTQGSSEARIDLGGTSAVRSELNGGAARSPQATEAFHAGYTTTPFRAVLVVT